MAPKIPSSGVDPHRLRLLAAVVRAGSISRAAVDLGLAQPSLSEQIRQFEEDCGQTLLIRHARGVRATAVTERLVAVANQLDAVLAKAGDVLSGGRAPSQELVVGASSTAAILLPELVRRFCRIRPIARLRLQHGNSRALDERVAQGALPLALVAGLGRSSRVRREPFITDHLIPVCAPDLPLPRAPTLSDLARAPILWREPGSGSRAVVEKRLASLGVKMKSTDPHVEGLGAQIAAAKACWGIAFLSELVIAEDLRVGTLRAIPIAEARAARKLSWVYMGGSAGGVAGELVRFARTERIRFAAV